MDLDTSTSSSDALIALRVFFNMYENDGYISFNDMQETMERLGYPSSALSDIESAMKLLGYPPYGFTFFNFVGIVCYVNSFNNPKNHQDAETNLRDVFRVFCSDFNGSVCRKELQSNLAQIGYEVQGEDLELLVKSTNVAPREELDFETFKLLTSSIKT